MTIKALNYEIQFIHLLLLLLFAILLALALTGSLAATSQSSQEFSVIVDASHQATPSYSVLPLAA